MIKIISSLLLLSLSFILFACSNSINDTPNATIITPTDIPAATTLFSESDSYPPPSLETEATLDSYPGVTEPTPTTQLEELEHPLDLPKPPEGLATIGGSIIDATTRQARPESLIYLGKWVYTDQGLPVVSLDRQLAPVYVIEPNGRFLFQNVDPGEYALVFFTPDYSFLLEDNETGESIKLEVKPGDIIDLGQFELP